MELKVLDHAFNDGTFTAATVYIALCTTIPTDASLGTNIVEATYTGYARLIINASDMSAASAGSKTNSATGAGNIHYWGTTTSKVIDTSNTPPTIAISGLTVTED